MPHRVLVVRVLMLFLVLIAILFLSSCGHHKPAPLHVPAPPPASTTEIEPPTIHSPSTKATAPSLNKKAEADAEADLAEPTLPPETKPIASETGLASWYGPPYHNRRGSNGEIYNMHAMTAAHRTYPLGSIVRVTNVKTGATALVRITDRGPCPPPPPLPQPTPPPAPTRPPPSPPPPPRSPKTQPPPRPRGVKY